MKYPFLLLINLFGLVLLTQGRTFPALKLTDGHVLLLNAETQGQQLVQNSCLVGTRVGIACIRIRAAKILLIILNIS